MPRFGIVILALTLLGGRADAHFMLMQPSNWTSQGALGDPQKEAPCGGETATDNGSVTSYKTGDTVTITVMETVPHPGFYRVFLAPNRGALPADTAPPGVAGDACGGMDPVATPTLPMLADGELQHTTAFSGPQTFQVTLPAGMNCDHCTLQVVEYMKSHGQPCFYHHCATINVTPNGGGGTDAGVNPGADAGTGGGKSSGGCAVAGGSGAALILGVALLALRRRRR